MKSLFENVINPYQILGVLIALRVLQNSDTISNIWIFSSRLSLIPAGQR